jgi:hypothetical protein
MISEEMFNNRKSELVDNKKLILEKIKELKLKEADIINNIDKVINFPAFLKEKNRELEDIQAEIVHYKSQSEDTNNNINIDTFKKYSISVIQQLDTLALQKEKPELINLAFNVMFIQRLEFEKLDSRTPYNL